MTERLIELERAEAKREALEAAAAKLETYSTNDMYAKALKLGARLIRSIKDEMLPKR